MRAMLAGVMLLAVSGSWAGTLDEAFCRGELIFPPEHLHNHGSCVVVCPNGDLLACWYNGSGERNADDVKVEGARLRRGSTTWGSRFTLADQPGFPDTNPCMLIDPRGRLWLFWQTIVANQWHTALCRYKVATRYQDEGPPEWDQSEVLLLKPGPEFAEAVARQTVLDEKLVDGLPELVRPRLKGLLEERGKRAGDKYFSRMGWMTRAHPVVIDGRRLIVPLYSDGYSFSLMALSDDWGATWQASTPLVSAGGVQPSIARKRDGALVAYMRDNGPPPKRLLVSESPDGGRTWSPVRDSELPNPGSGAEVVTLASGRWALIYNDTEQGRHSLAVSLSDDEGKSWKWTRHLERAAPGPEANTFAYPSLVQGPDGTLHATYTYTLKGKDVKLDAQGRPQRECIKHAHFSERWVMAGDGG
jgi:predicted neuraminidase